MIRQQRILVTLYLCSWLGFVTLVRDNSLHAKETRTLIKAPPNSPILTASVNASPAGTRP